MNNKNILDFFYSRATKRIKAQYERAHQPKYCDILPSNPKLLSYILNCKTTTKNNPYLITDGAIYALLNSDYFQFNTETEIPWGKEEEIDLYIEDLFFLLWEEYISSSLEINSKYYQCDYLPFAKHLAIKNAIVNENNEFLEVLFQTSKEDILLNDKTISYEAIKYVFKKNKEWFKTEWHNFASKTTTFTKLNKIIDSFVSDIFVPKLKDNFPSENSSLGIRAKNLLESDLSVKDQEIKIWGWNNLDEQIKYELFKASLSYVNNLEQIFEMQNNNTM